MVNFGSAARSDHLEIGLAWTDRPGKLKMAGRNEPAAEDMASYHIFVLASEPNTIQASKILYSISQSASAVCSS